MQQSTVEQELKSLPKDFIVFLLSRGDVENHFRVLKYLLAKDDSSGVYVSLDKPAMTMKESLIRNKIFSEKIYFIDLISERAGFKPEESEMLLASSPSNLTDLSIVLSTAMRTLKSKNKFIFFDTLSTLFNYNQESVVLKFVHYLAASMRNNGVSGIFILIKAQVNEKVLSALAVFGDKTIEV